MNKRGLTFKLLIIVIIIAAIVQQIYLAEYSYAFIGRGISRQSKPFIYNEGKLGVSLDVRDIGDDFIALEGWGSTETPAKIQRIYLYLKNDTDSILISSTPVERPDVSSALKSEIYRYSGYRVFFPTCNIKSGTYQIGFMIESNGRSQGKLTDQSISIENSTTDSGRCDPINAMQVHDHISLQRFYFQNASLFLRTNKKISYVSDTLPFPFNEIRAGEVQYCMAPVLAERGLRYDTILGFFPKTKSIANPENSLYQTREKYELLKDFGNGVIVLRKTR